MRRILTVMTMAAALAVLPGCQGSSMPKTPRAQVDALVQEAGCPAYGRVFASESGASIECTKDGHHVRTYWSDISHKIATLDYGVEDGSRPQFPLTDFPLDRLDALAAKSSEDCADGKYAVDASGTDIGAVVLNVGCSDTDYRYAEVKGNEYPRIEAKEWTKADIERALQLMADTTGTRLSTASFDGAGYTGPKSAPATSVTWSAAVDGQSIDGSWGIGSGPLVMFYKMPSTSPTFDLKEIGADRIFEAMGEVAQQLHTTPDRISVVITLTPQSQVMMSGSSGSLTDDASVLL